MAASEGATFERVTRLQDMLSERQAAVDAALESAVQSRAEKSLLMSAFILVARDETSGSGGGGVACLPRGGEGCARDRAGPRSFAPRSGGVRGEQPEGQGCRPRGREEGAGQGEQEGPRWEAEGCRRGEEEGGGGSSKGLCTTRHSGTQERVRLDRAGHVGWLTLDGPSSCSVGMWSATLGRSGSSGLRSCRGT